MPKKQDNHNWILSDKQLQHIAENGFIDSTLDDVKPSVNSGNIVLHIGYLSQGSDQQVSNSSANNLLKLYLQPGEMAWIKTQEKVHMRQEMVGIVFGSNTQTSNGLLIVNPGIITSGHDSEISFFAINISKYPIKLEQGTSIARLIVFTFNEKNTDPPGTKKIANFDSARFSQSFEYLIGKKIEEKAENALKGRLDNAIKSFRKEYLTAFFSGTLLILALSLFGEYMSKSNRIELQNQEKFHELTNEILKLQFKIESLENKGDTLKTSGK